MDIDDPFLEKLAAALQKSRRHLVAVSGGRDSVALLHGLHALGHRKLTVIHLDHRLRGRASRDDAKFVERLAKKLDLPFLGTDCGTREYAALEKVSLEHAGRIMRHAFFEGAAHRTRCRNILLAHHADDQIETCLFNFLRGSGAAGLAGMQAIKAYEDFTLLRPMLGIRRAEIDAFIARRKIKFREDATNAELHATRNKLRHRILPAIRETIGDSSAEAILRAATIFAAEDEWMQSAVGENIPKELAVRELSAQPLALRRRIVRQWLRNSGLAETSFTEVERVLSLLKIANGPAKVSLPRGRHARRRQGLIFLE